MKVRHLTLFVVIAASFLPVLSPSVLAGRPDSRQILFHPTLLKDAASTASEIRAPSVVVPLSATHQAVETGAAHRYSQVISELELEGGSYAFPLREPLIAQAAHDLQTGNAQAALVSLDRAMQITRIHEGLDSIGQVPILRTMINSHVELGDLVNAHRLQEVMLHVQLLHFGGDSAGAVPALLEWADWNVNLYLSDQREEGAPLQSALAQGTSTIDYANPFIQEAHARYVRALEILHMQTDPHNEHLVMIERKLAALNFMVDKDMVTMLDDSQKLVDGGFVDNPAVKRVRNFHFSNGESALKRALAYGYLSPEPDHDYIAARMLELADWHLLFNHRGAALDLYQETLELLAASNFSQHEIDKFFSAGLPVKTPDSAYRSEQTPEEYSGYIDVEVRLSKYGAASNTRLLADSDADPVVVDELLRTIRNCKFRPVFAQGQPSSAETVQLRYYYTLN